MPTVTVPGGKAFSIKLLNVGNRFACDRLIVFVVEVPLLTVTWIEPSETPRPLLRSERLVCRVTAGSTSDPTGEESATNAETPVTLFATWRDDPTFDLMLASSPLY